MARTKRSMGKRAERTLKSAMVYTLTLFVDVLIVYFIVRSFSVAYDFSYNVFSDSAKDPGAVTYVTVEIEKDASSMDIAKTIYKSGVIRNKYVMAAKLTLGKYGSEIKPGKYKLSASMTYNQIIDVLRGKSVDKNSGKSSSSDKSDKDSDKDKDD
ncbi:MAG: endolytic transglycosylase MltG [Eubacterium sp.]|nr:endolytic transglycosylase MltG [Eubacterium sp.]